MTRSDPLDELLERLSSESDQTLPPTRKTRKVKLPAAVQTYSTGTVQVLEDEAVLEPADLEPPPPPPEDLEASTKDLSPARFSKRHPVAFQFSRLVLPRLPVVAIVVPICYWMMMNLLKGDYMFLLRWYRESIVLPWLMQVVTEKGAFQAWWAVWGPFTIMVLATIVIALLAFYMTLWRYMFKDYMRYSEGVETREGRCYWLEGSGFWFNLWDGVYGGIYRRRNGRPYDPQREYVTAYIRDRAWPPINIASPGRKMLKVRLAPIEKIEKRGPFELVVSERKYRRIIGIREFATHDEAYTSTPLSTQWGKDLFKARIGELVKETQTLTKANVGVRLDKMKSGTIIVDEELKEMMLHERRKKDTGA
jgi:hypothetical protein